MTKKQIAEQIRSRAKNYWNKAKYLDNKWLTEEEEQTMNLLYRRAVYLTYLAENMDKGLDSAAV